MKDANVPKMMRKSCFPFVIVIGTGVIMENLIAKKQYKEAFELIVRELEADPESKEELKELFIFVLSTYR